MIKKETHDAKSPHYYPYLLSRYLGDDTTLTVDDYRYLYYGSAYQPSFDTTSELLSTTRDSISAIMHLDTLLKSDYEKLIGYHKIDIQKDPFAIRSISMLTTAYRKTGQQELYRRWKYKLNTLIDAIQTTGDGRSVATAYYVTDIRHEYDLLYVFGLQFGGEQSLAGNMNCDYLTVRENKYKIQGMYFNVEISMTKLSDMLGETKLPLTKKSKRKKK